MSRRKEIALVTAGILAGIAVSGPATQAAAGLMANPSSQKFYLEDRQINLQAYEIGGSNYVKLRDIGQAVDFGVAYDAATNTVTISPDKPYETEVIPPASTPQDSQTSPSALRACLISSDEDGNEGESKNLSRNNEFTLTIFPKPAEFVQPAEKALYHPTTRQHNKSV